MDAVHPGGLGGTFGGNPLACAAALVALDLVSEPDFATRAEQLGATIWERLARVAAANPAVGEVRGLGAMIAVELAEQAPELAKATVDAARERGLILLACGGYGNVIRLLPPLTISDADLEQGLDILEEALGDASGRTR